ncbi:MAG: hypothetical protein JW909_07505 [Planctomycetes bacterium]|nr:hypothetical protein [Planctomycetota bacterium]
MRREGGKDKAEADGKAARRRKRRRNFLLLLAACAVFLGGGAYYVFTDVPEMPIPVHPDWEMTESLWHNDPNYVLSPGMVFTSPRPCLETVEWSHRALRKMANNRARRADECSVVLNPPGDFRDIHGHMPECPVLSAWWIDDRGDRNSVTMSFENLPEGGTRIRASFEVWRAK